MVENVLFPSAEFRRNIDDALTPVLAAAFETVIKGSVVPTFDKAAFVSELAAYDFTESRSLESTLDWVVRQMEHGLVHVNHPRYFGLFNPTPTFPAQCADRITATFNPQLATSATSPTAVAIETHVIQAVAARVGLPSESHGHFTTGGSEANYTAVLLALTRACPDFAQDGARAFRGAPVFYVSRDCHTAWLKIAHQVGIGRSAMRLVPTDGFGRLHLGFLRVMIAQDRAGGRVPFMIAATAGTTNAGMIDPLRECARIATMEGMWYHVDAAWGGGLVASNKFRSRLAGIEYADSVTIDAHKWFATTMGCGLFITRQPTVLSSAFRASTTYMPSHNASVDPYVTTMQWSRRFLGLRLFLALAAAGWDGYGEHVEHSLAMADELKKQLAARDWITLNDSSVGVLCFVPPQDRAVKPIVARVLASGMAWVSAAMFEGHDVIRACITSGLTRVEDVTDLVTALANADETIYQQEQTRG